MIKTTGKEFKAFFRDPWPEGWILDGEYLEVNGQEFEFDEADDIPDDAIVRIQGGEIYVDEDYEKQVSTLTALFKQWRRKQSHKTFIVECPNELEATLREWITANGGKVLT